MGTAASPSAQTKNSAPISRCMKVNSFPFMSVPLSLLAKESRYACANPVCRTKPESAFYPTWTALQHHIRTTHPPMCPHDVCEKRILSSQKGLRAHLKLHEQRVLEDILSEHEDGSSEEDAPPRKRRRGGEVGRDWKCEVEGCTKDFKSVCFAYACCNCGPDILILAEKGSHNALRHHSPRTT